MKKRIVCLTLALLMSATQVVSVSASREDELREEQAITSQQLDATYSRMDELAYAKSQLENEISELDSNLVSVMVSIDTLKGDIDNFISDNYMDILPGKPVTVRVTTDLPGLQFAERLQVTSFLDAVEL